MIARESKKIKKKISKISESYDKLTGRGGLPFVSRYLEHQGWLYEELSRFESLKIHRKGSGVSSMIIQMILNFIDGTSLSLSRFDELRKQEEYGSVIGVEQKYLASTSSIKRLLNKCSFNRNRGFRKLFERLFIWRLKAEKPPYIILDVDTVVFDNNDAQCREGVSWTYKKVKGFQPIMIKWNGFVVSSRFRPGKVVGNHGTEVEEMLKETVDLIRRNYRKDVPVIVTFDSGFFDQKLMAFFEDDLEAGYIIGGKMYKDIAERVMLIPEDELGIFRKEGSGIEWYYTEFEDRRGTWERSRRAIFTAARSDGNQMLIKGAGTTNIVYTNLGEMNRITEEMEKAGCGYLAETERVIMLAHNRGDSELTHRHIKDFAGEQMPCKDFGMNEAYFNIMILSFNLHQAFKRDCVEEVIGKDTYPTTFRRKFIDFAGKIVTHAGTTVMKVSASVKTALQLDLIWEKAAIPV